MYIDTQNSSLKLVKDETKGADEWRRRRIYEYRRCFSICDELFERGFIYTDLFTRVTTTVTGN